MCLLSILVLAVVLSSACGDESYGAAVVEFAPTVGNITANLETFSELTRNAKELGADIIVFPEIGLNGYGPCSDDMLTEVPDPVAREVPSESTAANYSEALKALSGMAKDHEIYLVVNLAEIVSCSQENEGCPESGQLRYNTNVAFDRKGTVIARYRKYHIFGEIGTNITTYPQLTFFDTDFGVRFGTFICFDLMFDKPSLQLVRQLGITDLVYPTAWFSELPFLTAIQAQQMWAYTLDVNLLASGYNMPSVGSGGSGVFNGKDPLVWVFPDNTTSQLLFAQVPKKSSKLKEASPNQPKPTITENWTSLSIPIQETMYLKSENLTAYVSEALDKLTDNTLCHNTFCCHFAIKYAASSAEAYDYRGLVFDGVRTFDGVETGGIQACAIVMCEYGNTNSCGFRGYSSIVFKELNITGTFKIKDALPMPSTLRNVEGLSVMDRNDFDFFEDNCNKNDCQITMSLKNEKMTHLQTFGIYSRVFSRDGEDVTTAPTHTSQASIAALSSVVLAAVVFLASFV